MYSVAVAAIEQAEYYPYGKQRFFFEDMIEACRDLGLQFFFFSPSDWQADREEIKGHVFEAGQWRSHLLPTLPSIVYDRSFSGEEVTKQQIARFRAWLSLPHCPVLCLNPPALASQLDDKPRFNEYLRQEGFPVLETQDLEEPLFMGLNWQKEMAYYLKPRSGSGGLGIYVLGVNSKGYYRLSNNLGDQYWDFENIEQAWVYIQKYIPCSLYFIQPKAKVLPYEGSPYDLRVLIQNRGQGQYLTTGMGLRLGQKEANVANLQMGGSALAPQVIGSYYRSFFGRDWTEELNLIEQISLACCRSLERSYGAFFEIGLDFLLTQDQGPIIIEGNARPSRWVFNVIADRFSNDNDTIQADYYRRLRELSVRMPGVYALALAKEQTT